MTTTITLTIIAILWKKSDAITKLLSDGKSFVPKELKN